MGDVGGGPRSDAAAAAAAVRPEPPPTPDEMAFLDAAFQASAAGLALLAGPELRYQLVNDAFRALCPGSDDLRGQRIDEHPPRVAAPLAELARRVLEMGADSDGETEALDVPGGRRWFAYLVHRVEGPSGPGALISLRDNTSQVQARWAAEAAADTAGRRAAELEAVMEAIPDGIMVFDAAGAVVRMNAAALESWRVVGIDIGGGGASSFPQFELRGEDGRPLPASEWPVRRALAGEKVQGAHLRFAPAGARPMWMLASAAPILGADGRVTGAVLSFSDETALHELAEARDDLVRMVSHDLRTPLSAIYAQGHLIRRGADAPAKVVERAAAIERSCERMSGMIQDLVEVTLLESGQLPVTLTPVDVGALVPDILQAMRGGLAVDRVQLRIEPPCRANLDPARLERIVVNLVSNALKYSSQEVTVLLRSTGAAVVLSVADNGVGISTDDQARIFERYYRARGDRRPEGLGLGLYITRLLVEGMNGRVEVESQLGTGSTFRVVFPAEGAPPPAGAGS